MAHPQRNDKQHKLVSHFKEMAADLTQAAQELAARPAVKEFRAELRHTEHDLKHHATDIKAVVKDAAREIKAAVKDAAREIKAAFKSDQEDLQTPAHDAVLLDDTMLQELHTAPYEEHDPVRIVCDRGRLLHRDPEPESELLDATLIGVHSFDTMAAPVGL